MHKHEVTPVHPTSGCGQFRCIPFILQHDAQPGPSLGEGLTHYEIFADLRPQYVNVHMDRSWSWGDHMPTYFFHIRHGWDLTPDEEGLEFPDLTRANIEAYASARDLAAADPCAVHDLTGYAIEVTDEDGTVLSRIEVEPLYRVA